jgi:hypothetical protein
MKKGQDTNEQGKEEVDRQIEQNRTQQNRDRETHKQTSRNRPQRSKFLVSID